MKALIQANDGDFLEACEYYRQGSITFSPTQLESQVTRHMKRLLPWYQKVAAKYALEMKGKVETMRNRFAVEGMADSTLLLPADDNKLPSGLPWFRDCPVNQRLT
jgi:hypothetical protein